MLDDLEKVRIANENRLRQLTRSVEDSDGETRGLGLTEDHPAVARLAAIVETLGKVEVDAVRNLEKSMRTHPLGPWVKAQRGLGDKQVARLLAAIGDPYIRPEMIKDDLTVEPARPRLVSELWAYCGFHVIETPAGHGTNDAHPGSASGFNVHPGGQHTHDTHVLIAAGVAPKRQRGQKANWSETARKRAWLIANSVVKAGGPYREVYDKTKAKYEGALHAAACVRCGPSGKPAQPGSPLSPGHIHARALRAISKEVLKDLWREAKRLHEETEED